MPFRFLLNQCRSTCLQRAQGYDGFASLYIKGAGEAHTGLYRQESIKTPHCYPLNVGRLFGNLEYHFRKRSGLLWWVCTALQKYKNRCRSEHRSFIGGVLCIRSAPLTSKKGQINAFFCIRTEQVSGHSPPAAVPEPLPLFRGGREPCHGV